MSSSVGASKKTSISVRRPMAKLTLSAQARARAYKRLNLRFDAVDLEPRRSVTVSFWFWLSYDGVPRSKIVIDIPVYGRSFLGTDNIGQKNAGHSGEAGGVVGHKDLLGVGVVEDMYLTFGAASSVGGDAGFVSYDVPLWVTATAQVAKPIGLMGLFY